MSLGYKSLNDLIDFVADRLGCDVPAFSEVHGAELKEMKESRNLLLHHDLYVNATYISRAGATARSRTIGDRIPINHGYFTKILGVLRELVDSLAKGLEVKYRNYTRAAAIRRLQEYVFSSPILRFDDYWKVDKDADEVRLKTLDFSPLISTSETMFLGVWLSHYSGESTYLKRLHMRTPDEENQGKMLWLLFVFRDFSLA